MKRFTKEEIEKLSQAETYFRTAVYSNYKRATKLSLDNLVADIYENATGEKVTRNSTCGVCSLRLYKTVGTKYFKDKEYYEEEQAGDEIVEMIETMVTEKPKRGRKPLTKTNNKKKTK